MSKRENSQELESVETNSQRPTPTAQNMPTELELEEFFAAAEKDIQKRFQDKQVQIILNKFLAVFPCFYFYFNFL